MRSRNGLFWDSLFNVASLRSVWQVAASNEELVTWLKMQIAFRRRADLIVESVSKRSATSLHYLELKMRLSSVTQ
jgi:hypothetical protein